MPFIDFRTNIKLDDSKKEALKARFGEAISLLNKSENYLMIGFLDDYTLYFSGQKLEKSAYINVELFGDANNSCYDNFTKAMSDIVLKS